MLTLTASPAILRHALIALAADTPVVDLVVRRDGTPERVIVLSASDMGYDIEVALVGEDGRYDSRDAQVIPAALIKSIEVVGFYDANGYIIPDPSA